MQQLTGHLRARTGRPVSGDGAAARRLWDAAADERQAALRSLADGDPLAAESPARLIDCVARLRRQMTEDGAPGGGRILGDLDAAAALLATAGPGPVSPAENRRVAHALAAAEDALAARFVKRAEIAARGICRIVSPTGRGIGVGCLVAPGLLLTGRSVLGDILTAARSRVEVGAGDAVQTFSTEPWRLFHADPALDAALVALAPRAAEGAALRDLAPLPLVGAPGKIRRGEPVNLLHPLPGGRHEIAAGEWRLLALPGDPGAWAQFGGGTRPPAPGAPVFSDRWEMVALHRRAIPAIDAEGTVLAVDGSPWDRNRDPAMRGVRWIGAEGLRISALVARLSTLPGRLAASGEPGGALVSAMLEAGATGRTGLPAPPPVRPGTGGRSEASATILPLFAHRHGRTRSAGA